MSMGGSPRATKGDRQGTGIALSGARRPFGYRGVGASAMQAQAQAPELIDRMVPPANVPALKRRLPGADVHVYADSGHGVVSQNRRSNTDLASRFLQR